MVSYSGLPNLDIMSCIFSNIENKFLLKPWNLLKPWKGPIFLHKCATHCELPSYIRTMVSYSGLPNLDIMSCIFSNIENKFLLKPWNLLEPWKQRTGKPPIYRSQCGCCLPCEHRGHNMVFIIDGCSFHYVHTWSKLLISFC